jgi:hypothetical protein
MGLGGAMKDKEISTKAVLLGFLTDVGSTLAYGVAAGIVGCVEAIKSGLKMQEIGEKLPQIMTGPGWLAVGGLFGLGSTLLGGYVAGRIAGREHLLHGAITGGLGVLLGIACILYTPSYGAPVWYSVLGLLLTIPAGMAGGTLAGKKGND